MFHLDNGSGIDVVPVIKQTISRTQKWFTEGDSQTPPSYPGADWFNIVQAELLNVLKEAGIEPNKAELNQLSKSIKAIIEANKIEIHDASLTEKGIVNLSSAVDSASETEAATPLAVKTVNDKLDRSLTQFVSKTGDTIQNCLMVSADHPSLQLQNTTGQNMAHLLSDEGNFALIYKNRAGTWEDKLLFDCVRNEWRFDNVGRVKINHSNIVSMSDYQTNNGFRKSPDGYIHQWGEIVIAPTRDQVNFTVVFPVAFNERCDFFQAVYRNDACFITEIQRTQTFFRGCLFERLVGDGIIGGNLVWMAWGK